MGSRGGREEEVEERRVVEKKFRRHGKESSGGREKRNPNWGSQKKFGKTKTGQRQLRDYQYR